MSLKLESPVFSEENPIPSRYTCDSQNISPPLQWSDVPAGTRSFALIVDDPDAPSKTWVHWVLYDIPETQRKLEENIPPNQQLDSGATHGINDFNKYGYGGPCPPAGTHRYYWNLYALDTILDLEPGATKEELLDVMENHIVEQAELMGKYKRGG